MTVRKAAQQFLAFSLAATLAGSAFAAPHGSWSALGPEGAMVVSITVDPTDPSRVYAVTSGPRPLYVSSDGGGAGGHRDPACRGLGCDPSPWLRATHSVSMLWFAPNPLRSFIAVMTAARRSPRSARQASRCNELDTVGLAEEDGDLGASRSHR